MPRILRGLECGASRAWLARSLARTVVEDEAGEHDRGAGEEQPEGQVAAHHPVGRVDVEAAAAPALRRAQGVEQQGAHAQRHVQQCQPPESAASVSHHSSTPCLSC